MHAINKGTMSMRVYVPRSIDHNNTYARIKKTNLPMRAKISKFDVHLLTTDLSEKSLIVKIFLLLLRFFATDEELVVDVD